MAYAFINVLTRRHLPVKCSMTLDHLFKPWIRFSFFVSNEMKSSGSQLNIVTQTSNWRSLTNLSLNSSSNFMSLSSQSDHFLGTSRARFYIVVIYCFVLTYILTNWCTMPLLVPFLLWKVERITARTSKCVCLWE